MCSEPTPLLLENRNRINTKIQMQKLDSATWKRVLAAMAIEEKHANRSYSTESFQLASPRSCSGNTNANKSFRGCRIFVVVLLPRRILTIQQPLLR